MSALQHGGTTLQILSDAVCRRTCDFCSIRDPGDGSRNMTFEEIAENLRFFSNAPGIREVIFAGGEITDRPDLPQILDLLRALPKLERVTVVSRGHRWGSADLLSRAAALPLTVVWSFDVWTAGDLRLDRPHAVAARAIRTTTALAEAGIRVASNTVLSRAFIKHLPAALAVLTALPVLHSTLTFPFPKGGAAVNESGIVPSIDAALGTLDEVGRVFTQHHRPWTIKGMPVCYAPGLAAQFSPTKDRTYVTALRQLEDAQQYLPERLAFEKNEVCSSCSMSPRCDGFWRHYVENSGFPRPRAFPTITPASSDEP